MRGQWPIDECCKQQPSTPPPPPSVVLAFNICCCSVATDILDTSRAFPGKPRGGVSTRHAASHCGRAKGHHRTEEQAGHYDWHRRGSLQLEPHVQAAGLVVCSFGFLRKFSVKELRLRAARCELEQDKASLASMKLHGGEVVAL